MAASLLTWNRQPVLSLWMHGLLLGFDCCWAITCWISAAVGNGSGLLALALTLDLGTPVLTFFSARLLYAGLQTSPTSTYVVSPSLGGAIWGCNDGGRYDRFFAIGISTTMPIRQIVVRTCHGTGACVRALFLDRSLCVGPVS
jgi:glucose uptake protein GlcU